MKVLYFDYWTNGLLHQILPLDKILTNKGLDSILVHLGSWRDKSVKEEEIIDGLLCRDIKFYGNDIRNAFVVEKPDVVYVINMGGPIDRLVNRICRNLKIKTIFLMHGVLPTGLDLIQEKKNVNKSYSILYRLSKGIKYIKVYKMFGREILKNNFTELFMPNIYGHLIQMVFSPGSMYTSPYVDRDLHTDRVLVYSNLYKEEFMNNMKVPLGKINVVGNPNLDSIIKLKNSVNYKDTIDSYYSSLNIPTNKKLLIYLLDGIPMFEGLFSKQDWLNELLDVAKIAEELDWALILKLHPSNDRNEITNYLQSVKNVYIFQMEVDLSIVGGCKAAIGHISTTLNVPIAINIPVFIPRWTKVYAEYDYFISNGAAMPCYTIKELKEYLISIDKEHFIELPQHNIYTEKCIGPLDGCTWEKVANEIEMLGLKN